MPAIADLVNQDSRPIRSTYNGSLERLDPMERQTVAPILRAAGFTQAEVESMLKESRDAVAKREERKCKDDHERHSVTPQDHLQRGEICLI